jgi:hypothetical protein
MLRVQVLAFARESHTGLARVVDALVTLPAGWLDLRKELPVNLVSSHHAGAHEFVHCLFGVINTPTVLPNFTSQIAQRRAKKAVIVRQNPTRDP